MEQTDIPIYVLDRPPFRFVLPYPHIYTTHSKQRWYGKPLLQTLIKQFKAYTPQYFENAIIQQKILINSKPTTALYKIKNGDLLTHQTIRQEPPILNLPIKIVDQSNEFVVVEKPPSYIVHTGGGYHYNTLLAVLEYDMGYKGLFILHRLDRLTSGLILLAKNKQKATKFHEQSNNEQMKKMYFARVGGNFPFEQFILEAPIVCLSHKEGIFSVYDQTQQQHKKAWNKNNGCKQSKTKFIKVYYDMESNSSLLECYPITGRTHQIRVHLQYLGYPILNDTCYGGQFIGNGIIRYHYKQLFEKEHEKHQKQQKDEIENELLKKPKLQEMKNYHKDQVELKRQKESLISHYHKDEIQLKHQTKQQESLKSHYHKDQAELKHQIKQRESLISHYHKDQIQLKHQMKQKKSLISQETFEKWDFETKSWEICLHSYKYIFQGKQYFSSLPYWHHKKAIKIKCSEYYPKKYFSKKILAQKQKIDPKNSEQ